MDPPFSEPGKVAPEEAKQEDVKQEDVFATHSGGGIKDFYHSIFQACEKGSWFAKKHRIRRELARPTCDVGPLGSQADDPPNRVVEPSEYKLGRLASSMDNYFRITERGSTFAIEASGGMTTFFSMCYILVLNGVIIAGPFNTGIPVRGTFFATALSSGAPDPGAARATALHQPAMFRWGRIPWRHVLTGLARPAEQGSSLSSWEFSSTCPLRSRRAWA